MSEPQDDDLPCRAVVELITEYLDDALPDGDRARLEEHLADCDGCTAVLDQFRLTVTHTRRLAEDDVDRLDAGTRDELLGVFRRWSAGRDDGGPGAGQGPGTPAPGPAQYR